MSTPQINANRENAQHSTGPVTAEGKSRSSRNAIKLGLFTANAFVQPHEQAHYDAICNAFFYELKPQSPTEDVLTLEIIRAAWRLEICGRQELRLAEMMLSGEIRPETMERQQRSIDRARAASLTTMRRARKEILEIQAERRKQQIVKRPQVAASVPKTAVSAAVPATSEPLPPNPQPTAQPAEPEPPAHWLKIAAA